MLALEGIRRLAEHLISACGSEAENAFVRGECALAAYFSGITLANAGLGVVHGFASPIGAAYSIPHGIVCGTLLAPAMEVTVRALVASRTEASEAAINKMAQLGPLFDLPASNQKDSCFALVDRLYNLTRELKIPKLGVYGIKRADCETIAEESGQKNHPIQLTLEQQIEILCKRI